MGRKILWGLVAIAALAGIQACGSAGDPPAESDAAHSTAGATEMIKVISSGQEVDVADYIPDDGVVLIEFTADW